MSRLVGLLVLITLTACSWGAAKEPAQRSSGQREMQRISDEVRSLDGVTDVEAVYQESMVALGTVGVVTTVRPGTPADPLLDAVEQRIWTSSLNPLTTISLAVVEQGAAPDAFGVQRSYPTEANREELARKYGPRPVR